MSRFVILVLGVQACLIQRALSSQCGCNQISYGSPQRIDIGEIERYSSSYSYGSPELIEVDQYSVSAPSISLSQPSISVSQPSIGVRQPSVSRSASSYASYGGVGTGQVTASGDIGAYGETVVVGSVPVLGSVEFSGTVPAYGSVSISGQCGCGCY